MRSSGFQGLGFRIDGSKVLVDDVAPACEVLAGKGKLNRIFLPAGLEPNSRTCTTFGFSEPRLLSSLPCAISLNLTVVLYFFGSSCFEVVSSP